MKEENKPVLLGSLGLSQQFLYEGIRYRVITYPVSNHNPLTKRWCINLTTLHSEYMFCNKVVEIVKVPHGTQKLKFQEVVKV